MGTPERLPWTRKLPFSAREADETYVEEQDAMIKTAQ